MTLIENGEVFTPEAIGRASVLSGDGTILKVGTISRTVVEALEVELDVVDADGCFVVPGFIDPHHALSILINHYHCPQVTAPTYLGNSFLYITFY